MDSLGHALKEWAVAVRALERGETALVVRKGLDADLAGRIQAAVLAIDEAKAKDIMPPRYTGWVAATHATYKLIEDAGRALGRIKDQ